MDRQASGRLYGSIRCIAVFIVVAVSGLCADQVAKACALRGLSGGRAITIIPNVISLELYRNAGASLGFGSSVTALISAAALCACAALIIAGIRSDSPAWSCVLGLAFAGAGGNAIDRIVYADGFMDGKVVDFINYGWSVGNLADVFLTFAAVGFVILIFKGIPLRSREAAAKGPGDNAQDPPRGAV